MAQFFIMLLLVYGICTLFAIGVYLIVFDDWKYHWTWKVNGKLLIPYSASGIIALVVAIKWAVSIYGS